VFKETGSGAKLDRTAQRHEIDAMLVTELSRWGRSTLDLLQLCWNWNRARVSVIARASLTKLFPLCFA
jgi:hypothetical protein